MIYLSFILIILCWRFFENVQSYNIGVGRSDITGPAAGVNFMGYINPLQTGTGIHTRQFARTFIADDGNKRIAFVSTDMGMIGHGVRQEVIKKLQEKYGSIYNDHNVMISGTHTHQTPGGYLLNFLYDMAPFAGHVEQTFNAYIDGIFRSIDRAHQNMVDGKIFYKKGIIEDTNKSRSSKAYLENPQAERDMYDDEIDKEIFQLEFIRSFDGKSIGIFNWFAIHPDTLGPANTKISTDNVGYASMLMEEALNPGELPGKGDYVASMAASNLGDVVAILEGADAFERIKNIAIKITAKTLELLEIPGIEVTGPIDSATNYLEMHTSTVEYTFENDTTVTGQGCSPAFGLLMVGTRDFESVFAKIKDTMGDFPSEVSIEDEICHYPKSILLATGALNKPYDWFPKQLPTQVGFVGPIVLAATPGEFTTMSGRRLRRALREIMIAMPGINPDDVNVVIAGLSNSYSSYVATPEEYMIQKYEGTFTLYGPYTLPIYVQHFEKLLTAIVNGNLIEPGTLPPEYPPPRLSLITDAPADGPNVPGACRLEPPSSVQIGKQVTVTFEAGHPRNDLRQEDTFLTVEEEQVDGTWKVIANDASFETTFSWKKEIVAATYAPGPSLATITWTVPQNIVPGQYRIGHFGNYKSPLLVADAIPYFGYCNSFRVY